LYTAEEEILFYEEELYAMEEEQLWDDSAALHDQVNAVLAIEEAAKLAYDPYNERYQDLRDIRNEIEVELNAAQAILDFASNN